MLIFSLVCSAAAVAANKSSDSPKERASAPSASIVPMSEVHILMYQALYELTGLEPYLVSEKKFLDPKNESEILPRLDRLDALFKNVIRKKELQSPTFRLTGQAIDNHFRTAKQLYLAGRKDYSRWMLLAVPTACASCHTQLPEAPKPLWGLDEQNFHGTDFERAEFLFGTRNYDPALKLYDKIISDYPGNAISPENSVEPSEVETALQRKLLIYVRSKRDMGAAAASFERDLTNKNLPAPVKRYLPNWIKQLKAAAREPTFDFKKASATQTLRYAKRWLGDESPRISIAPEHPKLVGHLQATSALYGYLDTHETNASTPEILYWLAIGENAFNRSFFFSLGDMYLLECMNRYPSSPMAIRCYNEYADEVTFMYSGSRGTEIPAEVAQSLKSLKSMIDSKGALKTIK